MGSCYELQVFLSGRWTRLLYGRVATWTRLFTACSLSSRKSRGSYKGERKEVWSLPMQHVFAVLSGWSANRKLARNGLRGRQTNKFQSPRRGLLACVAGSPTDPWLPVCWRSARDETRSDSTALSTSGTVREASLEARLRRFQWQDSHSWSFGSDAIETDQPSPPHQ